MYGRIFPSADVCSHDLLFSGTFCKRSLFFFEKEDWTNVSVDVVTARHLSLALRRPEDLADLSIRSVQERHITPGNQSLEMPRRNAEKCPRFFSFVESIVAVEAVFHYIPQIPQKIERQRLCVSTPSLCLPLDCAGAFPLPSTLVSVSCIFRLQTANTTSLRGCSFCEDLSFFFSETRNQLIFCLSFSLLVHLQSVPRPQQ